MRCAQVVVPIGIFITVAAIVVPLVLVFGTSVETQDAPLVNTTAGMIRGLRADDGTAMFLGIPYAVVDDNNPFGAADLNVTFETTFNAIDDSARCPQINRVNQTTLDCLHLNIHVPKSASPSKPLPVFIYIHGGGFYNRSAGRDNIDPKFLVSRDVIFVSINYRLSIYGFLCLNTPDVPGNQGLKDQLNAMRWIKRNIRAFGGDDENITISGDSAGGIAVHLHVLFAEAGLFNKAITQSGTGFSPWVFHDPNVNAAVQLANRLGFETNETRAAISFLATQAPSQIVLTASAMGIVPGPCVEQQFPNVERFATTHPANASSPNAKDITLLAGYNSDEWLMMYANMPDAGFESWNNFNLNLFFGFNFGPLQGLMSTFVRRFYIGDDAMSAKHRRAAIDFDSDFIVNHPTQRTIRQHLDNGGSVYHYVFSYVGPRSQQVGLVERGAAHSDELRYLYDMPDLTDAITPEDQLMIDRITTLWTNFAKYGNPTPSTTELLPILWPPVTQDQLVYMNIDTNMEVGTRPFHWRLSFWDFFYHSNRQFVRGYGG